MLAVLYGVVTSLGVAFDLVVGDVLTPEVWVVVASIIGMVLLLLNAIPTLPSEIPSITGVALSPLLLVAYWQEYAASPDALSLRATSSVRCPPSSTRSNLRPSPPPRRRRARRRHRLRPRRRRPDPRRHDPQLGHRRQPDRTCPKPSRAAAGDAANRVFMPAVLQGQ